VLQLRLYLPPAIVTCANDRQWVATMGALSVYKPEKWRSFPVIREEAKT
jgi:hypothetical protein